MASSPVETSPLLTPPNPELHGPVVSAHRVAPRIARRLYLSHFLSTWNSRVFEFGAVLYLAEIFPGTLLPMSVYALVRGLAALTFASAVGHYIDTGNRLKVVRTSIVYQRLATAVSCGIFYALSKKLSLGAAGKQGMLALLIVLACVEKLCSIMNLVAVEKDWVVVVSENDEEALRVLNSQMRRIDIACKLLGPLFIALIDGWSTQLAIIVNFAMNFTSVFFEYFAIAQVYSRVSALQEDKVSHLPNASDSESSDASGSMLVHNWNHVKTTLRRTAADFKFYLRHHAFLASIAGALLYFTVLSFAGQMVTYLLSTGYNSTHIGIARTVSVGFEGLATWVAPWLMGSIGPVRAGLWFSTFQLSMLAAGLSIFWLCRSQPLVSASALVGGTILSRLGLWGFDLCIQVIVQEEVEPEKRGAFSSVEAAWQNAFELLSFGSTIIFNRPEQFQWPSLMSVVATATACATYALFVWRRRGHLLHVDRLSKLCKGGRSERSRTVGRVTNSISECDEAVVVNYQDVSDFNEQNILPQSDATQQIIRDWLKPTSYDAENGEYAKHRASHLRGTGEWLFNSKAFHDWHDGDEQGLLWIKGIPGSGKSVVAASLIETLSKEDAPVLFFFFRQIIDANHKPIALLRDWLAQILPFTIAYVPRVYCVVDALDEMDTGNDVLLEALAEFGSWRPSRVKVAMISRPVASVEQPLRRKAILVTRLQETFIDQDIACYVTHRLSSSPENLSPEQRSMIQEAVPGRANGIFLYAKLAMDALLEDNADVQLVLSKLQDLNEEQQLLILSFVTRASRPLRVLELAEMIRIVAHGRGVGGLKAIKKLVRTACGPLSEILPDETVCVVHHSLTEFLNGSTRVVGSRNTSSDSDSYPVLDMHSTHTRLAPSCLTYLKKKCLDSVKLPDADDYESDSDWNQQRYVIPSVNRNLPVQYPLLSYCLENWHVHTTKAEKNGQLSEALLHSIRGLLSGRNLEALLTLTEGEIHGQGPLHLAAKLGLSQFVAWIIQRDHPNVNAMDDKGRSPILPAAEAGHARVVGTLIQNRAKPNEASTYDGMRPLHRAACRNHCEIVQLLLDAGVDPMTPTTLPDPGMTGGFRDPRVTAGHPALMYAMRNGCESSAMVFIPFIKDPIVVDRALAWAASGGSSIVIDNLLRHPLANVNAKVRGETALYIAAKKPDLQSVISLLKAGADPALLSTWEGKEFGRSGWNRWCHKWERADQTALHSICGGSHYKTRRSGSDDEGQDGELELMQECLDLMFQAGVDVNAKDRAGKTALHYALEWWPSLVRLLIKDGADVNISRPDGSTPLHMCFNEVMVKILIEEGNADVNCRRKTDGKTPFLAAAAAKCAPAVVKLYANLNADLTLTDYDGKEAIHNFTSRFERYGSHPPETIDALLATGLAVDPVDNEGRTPLHNLEGFGQDYDIALRLVAAGANLNARDNDGRTPIFYFAQKEFSVRDEDEVFSRPQNFIDLGAQLDVVDYNGRNLLFALLDNDDLKASMRLIGHFLKQGLVNRMPDHSGNTLLHIMMARNYKEFRQSFAEESQAFLDDQATRNHRGQTPLHFLCTRSEELCLERLELFQNLDPKDHAGIRPLHMAARFSEDLVESLLAGGASPVEPTLQGFTPLHVAVRFRQPNIVGILLEALTAKVGKPGVVSYLNDVLRPNVPTPLHLACRSGVSETVAPLLGAGADPNAQRESVLKWCTQFEEEEALWTVADKQSQSGKQLSPSKVTTEDIGKHCTGGIKFEDPTRMFGEDERVLTRLEEILAMLYNYGAYMIASKDENGRTNLDRAIAECNNKVYTVACLLNLRSQLLREENACLARGSNSSLVASYASSDELKLYIHSLHGHDGASPFSDIHMVTASIYIWVAFSEAFKETKPWDYLWNGGRKTGDSTEEVVVLHEIIEQGGIVQPFLELPDLALEHRDPRGRTLLLSACGSRQNPDMESEELYYTSDVTDDEMLARLRGLKIKTSSMSSGSNDGITEWGPTTVQVLLQKGASITARDHEQRNALHQLLGVQSLMGYETMQLLLSKAPELLDHKDAAGDTPFHYAMRRVSSSLWHPPSGPDTEALWELLEAGVDAHQRDRDGSNALHHLSKWLAHKSWREEVWEDVQQLFDHFVSLGLPINGRNNNGETPIFSFLLHQIEHIDKERHCRGEEQRHTGALEFLKKAGADFFARSPTGETLLHVVARFERLRCSEAFLERERAMVACFRWLLEQGLDPLAEDDQSRACLDIAAVKGNKDILKIFERPS
ncbi:Solute carrier family 40 member 1 [Paramyrothecium foliicola]|nr:Solute carrier family 40 member 1 [Paramyrothecium foliicola]